jgi:hypothetical protein
MTQVEDAVRQVLAELNDRIEEEEGLMNTVYLGRKYKEKYQAIGRINGLEEAKTLLRKLVESYMELESGDMWEDYE